jgi:hypothetical protein
MIVTAERQMLPAACARKPYWDEDTPSWLNRQGPNRQQWLLPFHSEGRQSLPLGAAALGRPLVAIIPIPFLTRRFRLAAATVLRLAIQETERLLGCAAHCRATSGIVAELLYKLLYRLQQGMATCQ